MKRGCKLAFAFVLVAVAASGLCYLLFTYDAYAPDKSWPRLQAATRSSAARRVLVQGNTEVSRALDKFDYRECMLASHPTDPQKLVVVVQHFRGKNDEYRDVACFYSTDGGASWQLGIDLTSPHGEKFLDPAVAYGLNDEVYFVHMHFRGQVGETLLNQPGDLRFYRSLDGGKSWKRGAVIPRYVDRPFLAIDTTQGPHRGTLYCLGQVEEPIIYVSTDHAGSFNPPVLPLSGRTIPCCRPGNPAILSDGTVLMVYQDPYVKRSHRERRNAWPRPMTELLRTTDGGLTFNRSTPIEAHWWHDKIYSSPDVAAGLFPQLAADPGNTAYSGRVYCVWSDGPPQSRRIFFAASSDKGATWERPVVISEQSMEASPDEVYMSYLPGIAVNKDGIVAVSWYDRRGLSPAKNWEADGWNVRLRVSVDGGATWLPSVQINERPGRGSAGSVGNTTGLVATADGRFHAAWIGKGNAEESSNEVWSAVVEVKSE
jgi:hypothetical protein